MTNVVGIDVMVRFLQVSIDSKLLNKRSIQLFGKVGSKFGSSHRRIRRSGATQIFWDVSFALGSIFSDLKTREDRV